MYIYIYISFFINQESILWAFQVLEDIPVVYPTHRRSHGYDWYLLLMLKAHKISISAHNMEYMMDPIAYAYGIHSIFLSLYVLRQQSLERHVPWKIQIWILLYWISSVICLNVYYDLDSTTYMIYYDRS